MPKKATKKNYSDFETMLPQGIRSRHTKLISAMDAADDLLPVDAMEGTAEELRQALMQIQVAQTNLCELIAYRKMLGVD